MESQKNEMKEEISKGQEREGDSGDQKGQPTNN